MSGSPAGRGTRPGTGGSPLPGHEDSGTERLDGPGETVGASDAG